MKGAWRIVVTKADGFYDVEVHQVDTNSQGADVAVGLPGAPSARGVGERTARDAVGDCVNWIFRTSSEPADAETPK